MAATLYVSIRGDYSGFQEDMKSVAGIARTTAQTLTDNFANAFSKGDMQRGLSRIGEALKKLAHVAKTVDFGFAFEDNFAKLEQFAKLTETTGDVVVDLGRKLASAARDRQMEQSLRMLQRQCGLTATELSTLAGKMGLAAQSEKILSNAYGVRTLKQIEEDAATAQEALQSFYDKNSQGSASFAREIEAVKDKLVSLKREAMTANERSVFDIQNKYTKMAATTGSSASGQQNYVNRVRAREAVLNYQEIYGKLPESAGIRQISAAIGISAAQVRTLRDELDRSSSAFKALIGYAQVWLTFGFIHTAQDFVQTAMALENVKVAFEGIYGTSDMAEKKLTYVRQISDKLGLSFLDTAEGAKKLFAAANGTPVEKQANMVFEAFSNMSSAMKLSGEETNGVFLAISQIISKGKVSAEELRQQLAERMPGAVNLFAKSIGVSTQQLDKMLQDGKVTLEHFLKFAEATNKQYSAGAAIAGNSLQAQINRLKNTWVDFKNSMVDTGQLAGFISVLNSTLKPLLDGFAKLSQSMDSAAPIGLAAWAGSSLAAGGRLNALVSKIGNGFKNMASATKAAASGLKVSNTAMAATAISGIKLKSVLEGIKTTLFALGKNPVLAAFTAAAAAGIALITSRAIEAKKAFGDVEQTMTKTLEDQRIAQKAEQEANFDPSTIRKSTTQETRAAFSDWTKQSAAVGKDINDYKTILDVNGEDIEIEILSRRKKLLEETFKLLNTNRDALQKAFENKDVDTLNKQIENLRGNFETFKANAQKVGLDNSFVEEFDRAFGKLDSIAQKAVINAIRYNDSISSESTAAAKRLGLNLDDITKQYDKLDKKMGASELGKSYVNLDEMQRVRDILNDNSLAFDANTAAAAENLAVFDETLNRIGAANEKYAQDAAALNDLKNQLDAGTISQQEYASMQEQVAGESQLLSEQTDTLASKIMSAALAAGGTDASFNVMTAALQAAQQAGKITAESLDAVIQKVNELRASAQNAMASAYSANILQQAQLAKVNSEVANALKTGNKNKYIEGQKQLYQLKNKGTTVTWGAEQEKAVSSAYDIYRQIDSDNKRVREQLKKSRGGGSKRSSDKKKSPEKYEASWQRFEKEIASLNGETDKITLDKKFADINKSLKDSGKNLSDLKNRYLTAFSDNAVRDLNKEILKLNGNEKELRNIEVEEKLKSVRAEIEGITSAAKSLGRNAPSGLGDMLAKYEEALKNKQEKQNLEEALPYYEKITEYTQYLIPLKEMNLRLLEKQKEAVANILTPEVLAQWEKWSKIQLYADNGDLFAGLAVGFKDYAKEATNLGKQMQDFGASVFDGLEDSVAKFVTTGKLSFNDFANSVISDLARIAVRATITGPLASAFTGGLGSLFTFGGKSAKGNVFEGISGYENQIVTKPTVFSYGEHLKAYAKGGVMGEAGPEAIMPLTRMRNGKLGVESSGYGVNVPVNIEVVNETGKDTTAVATQRRNNDGGMDVTVLIKQVVAQDITRGNGGVVAQAIQGIYGVKRQQRGV